MLRQARASVLALTFSASLLTARPAPCAEPSAVDRPPPAHAVASDRRRIFVGVVGFLALVLGSVGFYLVRRQRKNEAPPALPPPQPSPAPDVATVQEAAPSGMVMVCPTCRRELEPEARYCKFDGNRLVGVQDGVELRGPSGGICPTCEHGFDPGVATCPTHGEELVPWALWQEEAGEEDGMRKICPVCGSQYAGSSGFCGADGTALETVN